MAPSPQTGPISIQYCLTKELHLILIYVLGFVSVGALNPVPFPFRANVGRDLSSLRDWANQKGIKFADGVGFVQNPSLDDDWEISFVGVNKTEELKKGLVILSVPKEVIFSSADIHDELGGVAVLEKAMRTLEQADLSNHKGEFLLFLKLLTEVDKEEISIFYAWVQSLPRQFSTGVCYDSIEMDCLPPFSRALADYEVIKLHVFSRAATLIPERWVPSNRHTQEACQALFKWAFNVVHTRCWKFSDEIDSGTSDIVPIGDLFNHKEPANIAVDNDPSSKTVDFVLQDTTCSGTGGFSLSYGLTNPHRFLVIFGFVDESMPEIFCQVVFPDPSEDHRALGCDDRSKMVYRTDDGAISETIWYSVLYALLASKPDERKALVDAHLTGDMSTKKNLHSTYLLETSVTLRNHVSSTLRELEALKDKIETARRDGQQHPNLELIEKHNDFLNKVFKKVEQRLLHLVEEETLRRRQIGKGSR